MPTLHHSVREPRVKCSCGHPVSPRLLHLTVADFRAILINKQVGEQP